MLNEMKIINEWPDTFESFIAKYSTQGSPRMIENCLVFQAIEHYFPVKECRTCKYYNGHRIKGACNNNIIENNWDGTVCAHFGCVDWRARE